MKFVKVICKITECIMAPFHAVRFVCLKIYDSVIAKTIMVLWALGFTAYFLISLFSTGNPWSIERRWVFVLAFIAEFAFVYFSAYLAGRLVYVIIARFLPYILKKPSELYEKAKNKIHDINVRSNPHCIEYYIAKEDGVLTGIKFLDP